MKIGVYTIDLDFGDIARDKVVEYVTNKHGKDKVCSLGAFQYIWAKGAIKDIGKVLGIPYTETDKITKSFDGSLDFKEVMESGVIDQYKKTYPELFDYCEKLSGLPKSFGVHPCGKVISNSPILELSAVDLTETMPTLMLDMHEAEDLGMVKFDFLGLRTVDAIYNTLKLIGKDYNYIAPHSINFDDDLVWDEFEKGHTDMIFQFSSDGMKKTLKNMKARSILDLTAANALYRPGSMAFIPDYTKRKSGEEDVVYLHPDLEGILKPTYGIIVFQEQLIEIGRLANMTNPDLLRKATGELLARLV